MNSKFIDILKDHTGKIVALLVVVFLSFLAYVLYTAPVEGFEERFIYMLKAYGYPILFFWSILEGETGLIMAGVLSHANHMNLFLAIFIAGLGGFVGDQIYFFIGRHNKKFIYQKLRSQRRKFAIAHLLLKKHGWYIIFLQRYMYGLRTILPMSIGLTRYSAKKFAFINLFSAWAWAAITIIPAWYLGEEILTLIAKAKDYWYFALPLVALFIFLLTRVFKKLEQRQLKKHGGHK